MVGEEFDDKKNSYYLFYHDLDFEEVDKEIFDKLEKEWKEKVIYFKVHKHNIECTPSLFRGYFAHSGYKFYDDKNQKIMVKEGGFTLWSINEKKDRSREVLYQVLDSKNRNKTL